MFERFFLGVWFFVCLFFYAIKLLPKFCLKFATQGGAALSKIEVDS